MKFLENERLKSYSLEKQLLGQPKTEVDSRPLQA